MQSHAHKLKIIQKIYERLLRESREQQLAALVIYDGESTRRAVFYDSEVFLQELSSGSEPFAAAAAAVRGYVAIRPPSGPCGGAWAVSNAWGPGLGKIVYGTAYAISPNGVLMPDRLSTSVRAGESWQSALRTHSSEALDDEDHVVCMKNDTHTEDPSDDCDLQDDPRRPWLDRAYSAGELLPGYKSTLAAMESVHQETVAAAVEVPGRLPLDPDVPTGDYPETPEEEIEMALRRAGHKAYVAGLPRR